MTIDYTRKIAYNAQLSYGLILQLFFKNFHYIALHLEVKTI